MFPSLLSLIYIPVDLANRIPVSQIIKLAMQLYNKDRHVNFSSTSAREQTLTTQHYCSGARFSKKILGKILSLA